MKKRLTLALAGLLLPVAALAQTQAPQYPTKPVRIVSFFSTGSGPDVMLRFMAEQLSKRWGKPVIIENKPGASGFIAASDVKRAAPDGYTLLHTDGMVFTAVPHLYKTMPYDAKKDFSAISPIHHSYFFIAVSSESKWNTLSDLITEAKAKPGEITFGSWQVGSVAHLGSEVMNQRAGVQMTHVPFKDFSQLYTSVANGEVSWAFGSPASAGPLEQAGKLKFLALAGPERMETYPKVPLASDTEGLKDYHVTSWVGLFAPKGTPQHIIDQINEATQSILKTKEVGPKMTELGYMPLLLSPEAITAQTNQEYDHYGKVIKSIGLTLE